MTMYWRNGKDERF